MLQIAKQDLALVCDATQEHWSQFQNQHLFITGGTGFFGRWLLETFIEANQRFALNAHTTVLTRNPAMFRAACPQIAGHPDITLFDGDIKDFAFPQGEFGSVIHAATGAPNRTLEFAASHGARRFLLISSGAVYGAQPDDLLQLPETYAGMPVTEYARGKQAAEALCAAYQYKNLACVIARPFAFVGPHLPLDLGFAIGNFIRDALAAQPIVIRGDPATTRSYLYTADLAIWLWTILARGTPLRPYNVGSGQAITMEALAEEVASVLCPGLPVVRSPAPAAKSRYVPDTRRAARELGLRQTISLREAIRKTAEFHGWKEPARNPGPAA